MLTFIDNHTRYPARNRAIFLLSVKAGLRAKEIANLTWSMVSDADGQLAHTIHLANGASKGRHGGRAIPLNSELKDALWALFAAKDPTSRYVITSERGQRTSSGAIVNLLAHWYRGLGFVGRSSHSGRRTFITNAARQISNVGGCLRDVQMLAGHSALSDMGLGEIGHLLSCQRDATFCEGYDKRMRLKRTQTIMQGASHCDFQYTLVVEPKSE